MPFGKVFDENEDENEYKDDEGLERAMRSCYRNMPRDTKASLTVKATREFITVHGYVSAVHPWLMGLREKILQASGDLLDNIALPLDTILMVSTFSTPDVVIIVEEEE